MIPRVEAQVLIVELIGGRNLPAVANRRRRNLGEEPVDEDLESIVTVITVAAVPTNDDKLLAKESVPEPIEFRGFGKIARQPILDIVLHPLDGVPRTAHREGYKKEDYD